MESLIPIVIPKSPVSVYAYRSHSLQVVLGSETVSSSNPTLYLNGYVRVISLAKLSFQIVGHLMAIRTWSTGFK